VFPLALRLKGYPLPYTAALQRLQPEAEASATLWLPHRDGNEVGSCRVERIRRPSPKTQEENLPQP
jgi:hypothetical protein